MNRRKFLRSGSIAVIAAAGLPKALKAQQQDSLPSTYRTKTKTNVSGQWVYEVNIFHNAVDRLADATDAEKIVVLKVAYFETSDLIRPSQQGEYRYKISKSVRTKDKTDEWTVTTKLDKKVSGDHKFAKGFPKNPVLLCKQYDYVEITAKNGESFEYLDYYVAPASGTGSGCFLTTACVQHKQLPDNCFELQQLRSLRDNFMLGNANDSSLVKQYYNIAPQIVEKIDRCENKAEIYEYMYNNMIVPSAALVADEKYEEAVAYYKTFVKALAEQYN